MAGFIEFKQGVGFEDKSEMQILLDFIMNKIMEITELHTFKEEQIPDIIANIKREDIEEILDAKKFGI